MRVSIIVAFGVAGMIGLGLVMHLVREEDGRAPKVLRAVPEAGSIPSATPPVEHKMLNEAVNSTFNDVMRFDIPPKDRAYLEEQIVEALALARIGSVSDRLRVTRRRLKELFERLEGEPKLGNELTALQQRAIDEEAKRWTRELVAELDPSRNQSRPAPAGHQRVAWRTITYFDYEPGMPLPRDVVALDGKRIAIDGYMIPTDYQEQGSVDAFLLTESLWGCCFAKTPQVHEGILVQGDNMQLRKGPVSVTGVFEVGEQMEDGVVTSVYRIREARVTSLSL